MATKKKVPPKKTSQKDTRVRDAVGLLKAQGVDAAKSNLLLIPVSDLTVVTDTSNPLFDPRVFDEVDADFIADIAKRGVINPVEVRKNGVGKDGRPILEVVDGRTRVRALKILMERDGVVRRCPVRTVHGTDQEMILRAIAENAFRKDETLRSLSHKVKAAIAFGASEEEVCAAARITAPRLAQCLSFMDLSAVAQEAIDGGKVPAGAISALVAIPRQDQADALASVGELGCKTAGDFKRAFRAHSEGKTYTPATKPPKMMSRKQITEWLNQAIEDEDHGTCAILRKVLAGK